MTDGTYGTVTVGRLVLRETFTVKADVHATTGERTVNIEGEESMPPLTEAQLRQRNEDIMTMRDMIMPIFFTNKPDFDGLYIVEDVGAELTDYIQGIAKFSWSIRASRIGPANSAEIESRLTGITRRNDWGKAGTLWHAPAIGHYAYYTGSTRPGTVISRTSEDGTVKVYYPIPADTSPRWSITPQNYRLGRARVKIDGLERTGTNMKDGTTWELSNGIVRATPGASGGIIIGSYNGAGYDAKTFNVSVGASATPIGDYQALSVLRNDFEMCTIRLVKDMTPMGRSTLDLSVRRGSRFVEGYLETDVAATLAVGLGVAENGTSPASGGYVEASGNDENGNKAIVGTARGFTAQTSRTGVQKNSATSMDFFVGIIRSSQSVGGSNPGFELGSASGWTPTNGTVRVNSAEPFSDLFDRTLSDQWGNGWTVTNAPASDFAVNGTEGIQAHPSSGSRACIRSHSARDTDITIRGIRISSPPTGAAGANPEVMVRTQYDGASNSSNDFRLFFIASTVADPNGPLTINITQRVNGSTTLATGFPGVPGLTNSDTVAMRVKVDGPLTRLKVWKNSDPEPAAWTLTQMMPQSITGSEFTVQSNSPGAMTGFPYSWFYGEITVNPQNVKHGSYSGKLIATTAAASSSLAMAPAGTTAKPGSSYTVTAWIRSPVAIAAGDLRFGGQWYNGATPISTWDTVAPALSPDVWTFASYSGVAPANTTAIGRQISIQAAAVAAGTIIEVDSVDVRETTGVGEAASDFSNQYIGSLAEMTMAVLR